MNTHGPVKRLVLACLTTLLTSAGCAAAGERDDGDPDAPPFFHAGGAPGHAAVDGDDGADRGAAQGAAGCEAPVLRGTIRDFRAYGGGEGHPDFEVFTGAGMKGIVKDHLGEGHKPVYALSGPSEMTAGEAAFDQWFRDTPGVNIPLPLTLALEVDGDGRSSFEDKTFFPIDGQGWGDAQLGHNFHFTVELRGSFLYERGESLSLGGDDDVWLFVNDRLALDLGGVHQAQSETLDLDARAADLGIEPGRQYPLVLFMAERHTTESRLHIESTLRLTSCAQAAD